VVQGVLSNALDFGGGTSNSVLSAASKKSDLVAVGVYANGTEPNALLATPKSGITSPSDLVGKKVAFEQGGTLEYLLLELLDKEEIDPGDVNMIPMRAVDMPGALTAGSVDAAIEYEPYVTQTVSSGKANIVVRMDKYKTEQPRFLFTTKKYIKDHPKESKAFIKAMVRGQEYIRKNKPADVAKIMTEYITNTPADIQEKTLPLYVWDPRVTEATYEEYAVNTLDFMKKSGNLDNNQFTADAARTAIDTTLLDDILKSDPQLIEGLQG
jgi:sulfonate transport system substrate-binding protein